MKDGRENFSFKNNNITNNSIYFSYSNYQSSMTVYYTNLKRFTRSIIVVEEGQTSRGKGN